MKNATLIIVGMVFGGLGAYGYARIRQKQKEQFFIDLMDEGKPKENMIKLFGMTYAQLKKKKKESES